ncbi:MAG: UDP-N-acetylmuramoyl-L-alanyl-D-glutamate--2,6-diaminopimelate ligase [Candidatus Ancillula sp.]|nr:UDP-N-acetylmuramoyl-L-alanyl-D-glutamate--2,6-diaminopimelate ligase [Candidatus Ancillula sp.]
MLVSDVLLNSFLQDRFDDIEIGGVVCSTKDIKPKTDDYAGDLFLCIKGATVDRHEFISQAIESGAVGIVCSEKYYIDNVTSEPVNELVKFYYVPDVGAIYAQVFQRLYSSPQNKLKMLAVTGTDGKTTTATLVSEILGQEKCGYIGTNGIDLGSKVHFESFNTTPGPQELYRYLAEFVKKGATTCAMEASSEAQYYNRFQNLQFNSLALTNITSEHLNTHGTVENYVAAKTAIFSDHLKSDGWAILNLDDIHSEGIIKAMQKTGAAKAGQNVLTYSTKQTADLQVLDFSTYLNDSQFGTGTAITLKMSKRFKVLAKVADNQTDSEIIKFTSPLLGDFNVENLMCALLLAVSGGATMKDFLKALPKLNVAGRLDMLNLGQDFAVMVDYAHTPNGVERLLRFANQISGVGRRITVIGQAGERDHGKRHIVGKIASSNSDLVIFTEDDQKHEDVNQIIKNMTEDLDKNKDNWLEIPNRKLAIKKAISEANSGDLVMILGKGADPFNKVGDIKLPYCDIDVAIDEIKQKMKS